MAALGAVEASEPLTSSSSQQKLEECVATAATQMVALRRQCSSVQRTAVPYGAVVATITAAAAAGTCVTTATATAAIAEKALL